MSCWREARGSLALGLHTEIGLFVSDKLSLKRQRQECEKSRSDLGIGTAQNWCSVSWRKKKKIPSGNYTVLAQTCARRGQCVTGKSPRWTREINPLPQLAEGTNTGEHLWGTLSGGERVSASEDRRYRWQVCGIRRRWGKRVRSPLWRDDPIDWPCFVSPRWLLKQNTKVTGET